MRSQRQRRGLRDKINLTLLLTFGLIDPPANVRMGFWLSSFASGPRAAERLGRGAIQRCLGNSLTPIVSMPYFPKQH